MCLCHVSVESDENERTKANAMLEANFVVLMFQIQSLIPKDIICWRIWIPLRSHTPLCQWNLVIPGTRAIMANKPPLSWSNPTIPMAPQTYPFPITLIQVHFHPGPCRATIPPKFTLARRKTISRCMARPKRRWLRPRRVGVPPGQSRCLVIRSRVGFETNCRTFSNQRTISWPWSCLARRRP